jgi:hypothetical protein
MAGAATASILAYRTQSRNNLQAAIDDPDFAALMEAIADRVAVALEGGDEVLLAGNGGSAGNAHWRVSVAVPLRSRPARADHRYLDADRDRTVIELFAGDRGGATKGPCRHRLYRPERRSAGVTVRSLPADAVGFDASLIQRMHITPEHIVCGPVKERLFPRSETSRGYGAAAR